MVKKEIGIVFALILALTLVSSGCAPKPEIDTQVIQDLQTKNVSDVVVVISPTASDELKNDLRLLGLEVDANGAFSGIVDERELKVLETKEDVVSISKKNVIEKTPAVILPQNGGQISGAEDEQTYERLRKEQNITVGPYIEKKVLDQIEKDGFAYVGIRFRSGQNEKTYHDYINSIKQSVKSDEIKNFEIIGIGTAFRATITEEGLNLLENDSRILVVGLVRI